MPLGDVDAADYVGVVLPGGHGTAESAPWLLASRLRELGARHESGNPYQQYNVQDGNLFTGQNPASSRRLAEDMIAADRAR